MGRIMRLNRSLGALFEPSFATKLFVRMAGMPYALNRFPRYLLGN